MSDTENPNKTGKLPSDSVLGNRYMVQKRLGQGGMGAVYLAYDQRLDIECAIKEMSTAELKTDEERKQSSKAFHEEAKLLARLNHPNLPRVTDHFTDHGKEYLVMEFVPGDTLAHIMRQHPPAWSIKEVIELAEPLTEVLHYLHTQPNPIIFRDLKPANIMRTPEGKIKLIDFGIARLFKAGQSHDTQAFGTMGYSAPEQYGQGQTDARSDIYSLAVLLHQLLTGHDPISHPFNIPRAHTLNPKISEELSAVLQTAMYSDPKQRFSSMIAFRRALMDATHDIPAQRLASQPLPNVSGPMPNYQQPTPQRPSSQPFGPPTSQPFGPPTRQSQPYVAAQANPNQVQPFAQPYMMNQPPAIHAQPYNPAQGSPVVLTGMMVQQPTRVSTGLAKTALWTSVIGFLLCVASFLSFSLHDASVGFAIGALVISLFGLLFSIIALLQGDTKNSLKGRTHAGIGFALSLSVLVLACVAITTVG